MIEGRVHSQIERGLLVLLGIEESDCREDVDWLAGKIARTRIFDDDDGHMNLSLSETGGNTMVISQFTLHASNFLRKPFCRTRKAYIWERAGGSCAERKQFEPVFVLKTKHKPIHLDFPQHTPT